MNVYEMCERLKWHYRKLKQTTFHKWDQAIKPIAERQVRHIDDDVALEYLEENLKTVSESTVKNRLNTLTGLWRKAYKKKIYKGENPWLDLDDGIEIAKREPEFYPWEYYEFFHNDPYFVCLWYTGMRISELAGIYPKNIKTNGPIWYFDLVEQANRGLKNKSSVRKVPIHPACKPYIDQLFFSKAKRPGTAWCDRFRRDMGLDTWNAAHTLRHNFVTRMNDLNVSGRIISSILGHGAKSHTDDYGIVKLQTKYEAICKL